eukprot:CAMPEP_0196720898 /NCGR_PEP_ID=MMETSP1091-20130531/3596_1 /TAXON_ID=302021 /ORGANISM="Rhodomonas sp., Strain CCMP768" /LENGTH=80 /DNA_ID=CAMNT_0042062247 /DNA_START=188 /DNA_END=426 /DNA_ORIENTATION=+
MMRLVETAAVKRGMERAGNFERLARMKEEDQHQTKRMIQLTQRYRVRTSTAHRKEWTTSLMSHSGQRVLHHSSAGMPSYR